MKKLNDVIVPPVIRLENVSLQQTVHNSSPPPFQSHRLSAATLYSAASITPVYFVLCSGSYSISQCSQFLQLSYHGRRDESYRHRLCYAVLNSEHLQSTCQEKCGTCGGQHHRLLWHGSCSDARSSRTRVVMIQVFRGCRPPPPPDYTTGRRIT